MTKFTKKRNSYNDEILTILKERFGYSLDYIRKSLRGDRVGMMPDKIVKAYKKLESVVSKAISEQIKNLNTH